MKTLILTLLLSTSLYAAPGNGNGHGQDDDEDGHPGNSNPPNENCAHCEPEVPIEPTAVIYAMAIAAGFCLTRKKL